jgi:hypothetical protein
MWADRTSEALEAIKEAAAPVEKFEIGWWYAETAATPRRCFSRPSALTSKFSKTSVIP